ncbi:hypothetical protein HOO31_02000 [Aliarcobacter cryaerophilus]|uniref:hypothetical protein n=1 Tax=Aliarcobacter cryaerophilus TaxID=28198 RepID=UPI00164CCE2B|nr:hypothetical protein [Aliarcobacter cryaerophilus]QNK85412.1 hypothetical protein HOO31_02000 [Aliarcobacter cryaerophilus]
MEKIKKKLEESNEISLVNNLLFYWMYYFIYSYKLIINFKEELNVINKKNSNTEIRLQIYYSLIGLITVNIVVYILEEYQYFHLNIHTIINEIQLIFVYISIYIFFIVYTLLLNLIVFRNFNKEISKSIILATLKIFNLIYPLFLLFLAFCFDTMITSQIKDNENEDAYTIISNNIHLLIIFIIMALVILFSVCYLTFNFLKMYTKIKSKLIMFIYFVSIYFFSSLIVNIFIYPYTLAPLSKHFINSDNLCENVTKLKFKLKENYNYSNLETDLKQCYKTYQNNY